MDIELTEEHGRFWRQIQEAANAVATAASNLAAAYDQAAVALGVGGKEEIQLPQARGPRQQEIFDVLAIYAGEQGLKTSEIAKAVNMDQPNVYLTLQSLQEQGLVEQITGVRPQRWRSVLKYRLSQQIIEVGGLVKEGEWTAYGDISQVVYGHAKGGLAVGRVAARHRGDFPNPHRVLQSTGKIPDDWRDNEGEGPKVCARRLKAEGVEIIDEAWAHPRSRVDHEELSRRLERKRQDDEIGKRLRDVDD